MSIKFPFEIVLTWRGNIFRDNKKVNSPSVVIIIKDLSYKKDILRIWSKGMKEKELETISKKIIEVINKNKKNGFEFAGKGVFDYYELDFSENKEDGS